jgi:outer membrane protein assembly factor BamB
MAFGHHQKHGIAVMLGGLVLTAAVCAAPAAAQDEPKIEGNALELKWHASMGANSKSMSSCPAIGNLDAEPGLEICTASNGCGNADRYVCFDSNGKVMSDYKTDNGEARAPACIADVNGDGIEECIGGSASGWMVHLFSGVGKRMWRFECENRAMVLAGPACAEVRADYPGMEIFALAHNGKLYCLSAAGQKIWSYTINKRGGPTYPNTPIVEDVNDDGKTEVVYVTGDGQQSFICCVDAQTGTEVWRRNPCLKNRMSGNPPYASPVALVRHVDACRAFRSNSKKSVSSRLVVGMGRSMFCLDGLTGEEIWKVDTEGQICGSPAVGDCNGDRRFDAVFVSTSGFVYCVDTTSGKLLWKVNLEVAGLSSPALANRRTGPAYRIEWGMLKHDARRTGFYGTGPESLDVYVGSETGKLFLIQGKSGKILATFTPPTLTDPSKSIGISPSPSVADIDGDGTLEVLFTLVDRLWCLSDKGSVSDVAQADDPKNPKDKTTGKLPKLGTDPGNRLVLANLVHEGETNPNIPSLATLMKELSKRINMDVVVTPVAVEVSDPQLYQFPLLYVTGHFDVKLADEDIEKLRAHLKRGAILIADDCCGSKDFDASFRLFIGKVLPDAPLRRIPATSSIFQTPYEIKECRMQDGTAAETELEGVFLDDKLAVIYSKRDLGCNWSCPKGCPCLAAEDAVRTMTNIVYYALTE